MLSGTACQSDGHAAFPNFASESVGDAMVAHVVVV
jgi:hypothetical protein